MKGVYFDSYHSYTNFNLVLSNKVIKTPSIKTKVIAVEGMDGNLDLTEYHGKVSYENRLLSFSFTSLSKYEEFDALYSDIQDALHGKKMKIIIDDDDDYYYIGRVTVNEWKSDRRIGKISIDCDCEPYKYKKNKTVVTKTINGNESITLSNLKKQVVPIFKVNSNFTIMFENQSYSIVSGTNTIEDIVLMEGDNSITVIGNGTLTIEYQEGRL